MAQTLIRSRVVEAVRNALAGAQRSGTSVPASEEVVDAAKRPGKVSPVVRGRYGSSVAAPGRLVPVGQGSIPVVRSHSGGAFSGVAATGRGRVFPAGDVEALAKKPADVRDDAAFRCSLAVTGWGNVTAMFSLEAAADTLQSLLGARGMSCVRPVASAGRAS